MYYTPSVSDRSPKKAVAFRSESVVQGCDPFPNQPKNWEQAGSFSFIPLWINESPAQFDRGADNEVHQEEENVVILRRIEDIKESIQSFTLISKAEGMESVMT